MSGCSGDLRIALLGMSDNPITRNLVRSLRTEDVHLDAIVLQAPGLRANLGRLRRKFAAAGMAETIRRVVFAIRNNNSHSSGDWGHLLESTGIKVYVVKDPNGDDVKQILENRMVDVLLLSTDSIIRRSVFSVPKRATLNAHPGRVPQFRGLGGLAMQVSRGIAPSMSVHIVNEGVDTGPVLLREDLPDSILHVGPSEREEILTRWQARLFARTLRKIASGDAKVIDTFLEPSNMTRGVPRAFAERAWGDRQDRRGK